jgi:hypothetical protein
METADRLDLPGAEEYVRLHHGTDVDSATDILNSGLDPAKAAAFNVSGEFWATTDVAGADTFAQVNPAAGVPARFDFDLPRRVLTALLSSVPPMAYQHGAGDYEFLPASFPDLNRHMANGQVVSPVP